MKALSIIALCVLLQGCFYQTVNQQDIYRAVHFCKGAEKIAEITSSFDGFERVYCRNGTEEHTSRILIDEK